MGSVFGGRVSGFGASIVHHLSTAKSPTLPEAQQKLIIDYQKPLLPKAQSWPETKIIIIFAFWIPLNRNKVLVKNTNTSERYK